jgi:hypothetical protein
VTDINALLAAVAEQLPPDDPDKCASTLAGMSQPAELYPAQITVFCDHCGTEATRDYVVSDDMTRAERLAVARKHLVTNEGWQHDDDGDDFCPTHAAPTA